MKNPINREGEAMPQEHPWAAARRHAKSLADTLALCDDGSWYAHVSPSNHAERRVEA